MAGLTSQQMYHLYDDFSNTGDTTRRHEIIEAFKIELDNRHFAYTIVRNVMIFSIVSMLILTTVLAVMYGSSGFFLGAIPTIVFIVVVLPLFFFVLRPKYQKWFHDVEQYLKIM